MNQIRETEVHTQLEAGVGLEDRRGQYRLRLLRPMHLPQVADGVKPWLPW